MAWIMTKGAPWSKKWQIMTKAHVGIKTTDGYLFELGLVLLKKHHNQIQKTSYAQHQLQKLEIMTGEMQTNDLIPDSTGKDTEKACQSVFSTTLSL